MLKRIVVGGLSLTAAGLISIATWEGFKDEAYIPVPGDVPTIGFGTTEGVELGDKISVPEALNRLDEDVHSAESAIKQCVLVPLSPTEYDVYVGFAYNVGATAFCSSTLVKKLNALDYAGACAELKRWVYVDGKVVRGLVNRRADEYERCMGAQR